MTQNHTRQNQISQAAEFNGGKNKMENIHLTLGQYFKLNILLLTL